ncbi:hypothetical protein, partial [Neolewinella sp.]|uniref:hypothetical protein n=1 Tax=Neolewinella sp. TaxID=2993543 RepID=UPI003B51B523
MNIQTLLTHIMLTLVLSSCGTSESQSEIRENKESKLISELNEKYKPQVLMDTCHLEFTIEALGVLSEGQQLLASAQIIDINPFHDGYLVYISNDVFNEQLFKLFTKDVALVNSMMTDHKVDRIGIPFYAMLVDLDDVKKIPFEVYSSLSGDVELSIEFIYSNRFIYSGELIEAILVN